MRRKKQESGIEYDEKLLQHIAPIGNMTPYNSYCRTGTGYEACVHIFSLPTMLDDFWMTDICNFQNSVATISIGTMDEVKVKQNLNKAIEEQASRMRFAKDYSAYYDAKSREEEMQRLYEEISSLGEVMKSISMRIFVTAKTKQTMEERVAKTIKTLEGNNYRAAIFLNEAESEWKSIYQSMEEQQLEPHALSGFPMKATLLAAGNAYHYSCLEDDGGDFLGETGCGGNVLYNEWMLTETRVNASAIVVGNQRFGKSTLLKLRIKSRVLRGDYVRVIDVVGEFTDEIRALAGRTLDMSRYIINLLEIFRSGENEEMNYARHLAKLRTSYKFLCPEADGKEINDFTEIVEALYKSWGLKPNGENQITGLPAKAYPIFGDLLEYVDQEIEAIVGKKWRAGEKILVERKLINLDRIRSNLRLITSTCRRRGTKRAIGSIDKCQWCGAEYTVVSGRQKYCSEKCQREACLAWQRERKRDYNKTSGQEVKKMERRKQVRKVCVYCGRIFMSDKPTNLCSEYCKNEQKKLTQCKADIKRGYNRNMQKYIDKREKYREKQKMNERKESS